MRNLRLFAVIVLLCLGLVQVVQAADDVHWAYSGEAGPEHWGALSPDYHLCADGTEQSPVNIPSTAPVNNFGLSLSYQSSGLTIGNNGHTIRVDYDKGSSIQFDGKTYNLSQFHFHAKSEHTINGQYSPMEVHFVNVSADGQNTVIGARIVSGSTNPAYDAVLSHMQAQQGNPQTIAGATINAANLLPANKSYYYYMGSLTTPPCTESVNWIMLTTPLQFSDAQIAAFTAIYSDNHRPIQPLNNRTFLSVGASGTSPGMPTTGQGQLDPSRSVFLVTTLIVAGMMIIVGGRLVLSQRKQDQD